MEALDSTDRLVYAALLVLLLVFSAFFSACETALLSVNRLRLRRRAEEGDTRAKSVLQLLLNHDKTLFSILVANNLVNLAAVSIATVAAKALFGPRGAIPAVALVIVLLLTFGEILPKAYARDHSELVALQTVGPLRAALLVLTPFTALFSGIRKLLAHLIPPPEQSHAVTEEELIDMIGAIDEAVLEEQERELVRSALEFDEISIHEIVTPRVNIVALDVNSTAEEVLATVVEEGYSRIPVYEDTIDNIVGVLYSREYLNAAVKGQSVDLRAMLNEPLFVPKRMRLSQILALFKARKVNLAVVTDDYGGTVGIVTMEDVLEELVGDIWDEDDEIPVGLVQIDRDTVEVAGDYRLEQMLAALGVASDQTESDYVTVNGWALHLFEHIPEVGESLRQDGLVLVVLEMNGHRIKRLRVARRD